MGAAWNNSFQAKVDWNNIDDIKRFERDTWGLSIWLWADKNGDVHEMKPLDAMSSFMESEGKGEWRGYYINLEKNGGVRKMFSAETRDGKLNGKWVHFSATGRIQVEGGYKNNKKHGVWKRYSYDGATRFEGEYKEGEPDGIWIWNYQNKENCSVVEVQTKEEYNEGKVVRQLKEEFRDGKFHGERILYHQNGRPKTIRSYNEGKLLDEKNYDCNGKEIESDTNT